MKKLLTVVSVCIGLFFTSCDSANMESNDSDLSDTEVQVIYDSAQGAKLNLDTLPKYKKSEDLIVKDVLAVLESEIPTGCVLPSTIGQLNGGVQLKLYKFDHNMNASAQAMGFSGEIGKKQMLFIQDFIRFDYVDCGGERKKVGIGLRCYIYVTSFKGKIGYTKLPGIAANVELGRSSCSFELSSLGFGINGSVLAEGLNPQGDYTVENFGKLAVTFNNVLKLLDSSNTMPIRPVELP